MKIKSRWALRYWLVRNSLWRRFQRRQQFTFCLTDGRQLVFFFFFCLRHLRYLNGCKPSVQTESRQVSISGTTLFVVSWHVICFLVLCVVTFVITSFCGHLVLTFHWPVLSLTDRTYRWFQEHRKLYLRKWMRRWWKTWSGAWGERLCGRGQVAGEEGWRGLKSFHPRLHLTRHPCPCSYWPKPKGRRALLIWPLICHQSSDFLSQGTWVTLETMNSFCELQCLVAHQNLFKSLLPAHTAVGLLLDCISSREFS